MKLRMIKSDEEINIIKNGARIADIGAEEIVKHIKQGQTELEISILGRDRMERKLPKHIQELNTWILGYGFNQELIQMVPIILKQIEH